MRTSVLRGLNRARNRSAEQRFVLAPLVRQVNSPLVYEWSHGADGDYDLHERSVTAEQW